MRRVLNRLFVVSVVLLAMAPICCADTVDRAARPMQARVETAGAMVRSGPAETYYLTDTLPEDAVVEIYRREPSGWCAIRPPKDSFSWVYAQHVERAGDGLARINKDDVPARVGSRLSSRRSEVQVRLHRGELVEILGDDSQDGEAWCKIAPPAGEFRWVHAKDLAPVGSEDQAWEPAPTVATASLEESADGDAESESEALTAPPLADESTTAWAATGGAKSAANSDKTSNDITPVTGNAPNAGSAPSVDFARELAGLELRLSRMVAEPTETWSVEALEQAAERLLSQADTVPSRDAVKVTLAKIDRFAAIQRRHQAIHGRAFPAPRDRSIAEAGAGGETPEMGTANAVVPNSYDAVGRLRPVVSRRPGAPQFALVNDQGQVVSFLTPTPDLNLQPYLGRRIGVVGSRGYIPEFRRAHVTASGVTPLSDRLLR